VNLVYLHGFASSPLSTKAQFFRARLADAGFTLAIPELAPDFANMTITSELAIVEPLVATGRTLLFGSSLGGYLAALVAERNPERVAGLVLFAPAFGFAERWESQIGPEAMARWRADGVRLTMHYGTGREEPLSIALLDDAGRYPSEPRVSCPTLIFAGRRDDAVPLATVEHFVDERRSDATIELVCHDAGHELTEVLEPMWQRTERFVRQIAG
jgi:hypothetical protein